MELMTLGVNKFTEDDVKAAARALTGYYTNLPHGRRQLQRDAALSTSPSPSSARRPKLNAESLVALIVSKQENAKFITDRLWFRFVSGTTTPPPSLGGKLRESRHSVPRECAGRTPRRGPIPRTLS